MTTMTTQFLNRRLRNRPRSQKEKPLEIDMINLIPVLPDGDTRTSVPLTCAPCTNGILVKGNKGLDREVYTCTIEMLEYVISRKKAFVSLSWEENSDFTSWIPASSVRLPRENYTTLDPVDLDSLVCPIDRAYAVVSAIKRSLVSVEKNILWVSMCATLQLLPGDVLDSKEIRLGIMYVCQNKIGQLRRSLSSC